MGIGGTRYHEWDLHRRRPDQGRGSAGTRGEGAVRGRFAGVRADGRGRKFSEGRWNPRDRTDGHVTSPRRTRSAAYEARPRRPCVTAPEGAGAGKACSGETCGSQAGGDKAEAGGETASTGRAAEKGQGLRRQRRRAPARVHRTGVLGVYLGITCISPPQAAPTSASSGRGTRTVFA